MRVSQQEKDQSRERIVRSAARLLRERGVEGASVGEVMKDAGMTHGGFYRHFASKDALVEGALDEAFREILEQLAPHGSGGVTRSGKEFRDFYLSNLHLDHAGQGCPAVALAGDVARASPSVRQSFSTGVRKMLSALSLTRTDDVEIREVAAARELSMIVGAMILARASDAETAALILSACRRA